MVASRLLALALLAAAAADAACTQGVPNSCTYPPGMSDTASTGPNINPCFEYYSLVGVATGVQVALADPKVGSFSAPTPSTFCYNYYCGPNAGVTGGVSTQTFTGACAAGYYGAISGSCAFRANCWYAGNYGSIRGLLMYNFGANQCASSVGGSAALAGNCSAAGATIYSARNFARIGRPRCRVYADRP
jgi:hypothetical protein